MIMKNIFKSESVSKFQKMLEESDKIVLTAHMRPDGDALGSTLVGEDPFRSDSRPSSEVVDVHAGSKGNSGIHAP